MATSIRKIAINTGGGDAPGLNAVIHAATLAALERGWEVWGIRQGYRGLLEPGRDGLVRLDRDVVRGIGHLGGTILGSVNRGDPFHYPMRSADDGALVPVDRSADLVRRFIEEGFDALIPIGGDGSMRIAQKLVACGLPVAVGVPKTIDNDVWGTDVTFGFDTAVAIATDAIDRLHTTAEAHRRIMVVEVMGRYTGWIALYSGLGGGADVILIPEIPYDLKNVAQQIQDRDAWGAHFSIVVVAEGAKEIGGSTSLLKEATIGRAERVGGVGHRVAAALEEMTGKETRTVVLGHLQRGGSPTAFDRVLATRFGGKAVELLKRGETDRMVAFDPPAIGSVPLADIVGKTRTVPADFDVIHTARAIGVSFGN
jgi:ATP-dependent phosphofructokinase / diphosphate-dependent phosphofructokinase